MSRWSAERRPIPGGERLGWRRDERPATLAEWICGLRDEPGARAALNEALAASPLPAFFWESAPLAASTAGGPAIQDLLSAPLLAEVSPEPEPFADKFSPGQPVARFKSLGGDATLIAPAPLTDHRAYPHLGAFVRLAPAAQRDALWAEVGRAAAPRLTEDAPRWLSTAGMGVSWLHVRLDTRPKYYRSAELRRWPPGPLA